MNRPALDQLAQALAEPRRLQILQELLGGVPLPVGALATRIGVAPSTVTSHVSRLLDAGLLDVEQKGRTRLVTIADPAVAEAVEALLRLTGEPAVSSWAASDRRTAMRRARSCYDHLAGDLGIAVADRLVQRGLLDADLGSASVDHTGIGAELGLELTVADSSRPFVRGCLDWTARRPHVAGRLGAALLDAMLTAGWVTRRRDDRSLRITPHGAAELDRLQL
ncbi:helix-turn-helix transcriptional regulator [Microbacterium sp. ARD32]|uniref:ArsR/SmtB family transcription factor n=1 Tax=Microbacterium sp. ARD32 TaxID=2962577 RepID=UPI002880E663|nr:helix-turn-helix transcriptional regulator [Microbacterium sp. ARD32]MDT0156216.1 helix-turn-helix transcriptional regulator [Microbacterium sp. ARD32]